MDKLRVGVIGVGKMGRHHARAYTHFASLCDFIGVCDVDPAAGQSIADQYGVRFFRDPEALLEQVDAVTIAVPTDAHLALASTAAAMGKHFLLEKPVCMNATEAETLERIVEQAGVIAQVGHIERFNPAVQQLHRVLQEQQVVAVEAKRVGPYDPRVSDLDVIQDLMIHDLDVVRYLFPVDVVTTSAVGRRVRSEQHADYAVATLSLDNGVIANLTASRVTEQKTRCLTVISEGSVIELDYMQRRLSLAKRNGVHRNGKAHHPSYQTNGHVEAMDLLDREPVLVQTEHFLECVRGGKRPLTDVTEGKLALQAVETIQSLVYASRVHAFRDVAV